ncbi:hypothetical protein QFZ21_002175 [Microbacterium sp. W4I20]|nr:hypothetical protein [Microbacterium sp. W4I20]
METVTTTRSNDSASPVPRRRLTPVSSCAMRLMGDDSDTFTPSSASSTSGVRSSRAPSSAVSSVVAGSTGGNQLDSCAASAPVVVARKASSAAVDGSSGSPPASTIASDRATSASAVCAFSTAACSGWASTGSISPSGPSHCAPARSTTPMSHDLMRRRRSTSASPNSQAPSCTGIGHASSVTECTRPPMRSRASNTVTSRSAATSRAAAVAPARPAPITATRSPDSAWSSTSSAARAPERIAPRIVPGSSTSVASPAKNTRSPIGRASCSRVSASTPTGVKLTAP